MPASDGSASTISRATCASLRFSAASAAFHSTRTVAEPGVGTLGQQHLMVLRRVAVLEVVQLPRALRGDRRAFVVGGRAHGAAAGAAGDVARAGKLDGHDRDGESVAGRFASRIAVQCILRLHALARLRLAGAEPAARFSSSRTQAVSFLIRTRCFDRRTCHDNTSSARLRNLAFVPWQNFASTSSVVSEEATLSNGALQTTEEP